MSENPFQTPVIASTGAEQTNYSLRYLCLGYVAGLGFGIAVGISEVRSTWSESTFRTLSSAFFCVVCYGLVVGSLLGWTGFFIGLIRPPSSPTDESKDIQNAA